MADTTEKNKYLAERMGVECFHDFDWDLATKMFRCSICCQGTYDPEGRYPNPDYFTLEGRQQLLEWAVKEKWWGSFLDCHALGTNNELPLTLLIPVAALVEAIYTYLKEQDAK